jgi:hypothetical protein
VGWSARPIEETDVNAKAARAKGIASHVAGHANVPIAPNLESGNMLAKGPTFVARAEAAGLAAGASARIILTSRADDDRAPRLLRAGAAPRILAARGPGPRGGWGRRAGGGVTA